MCECGLDPGSVSEKADGQDDHGEFEKKDGGHQAEHGQLEFPDRSHVEQHADGDEEQAVENVLERQDVGYDLMAVLGFGDQDAGQERAQGQRQAER